MPSKIPPRTKWQGWGWSEKEWAEYDREHERTKARLEGGTFLDPMDPLPHTTEDKVKAAIRAKPKVTRKVEWRSPDGKMVVVAGPFPRGFFRSDTRDTVAKASRVRSGELWAHEPTEREDRYAKCLLEDVVEILEEENDFGTVTP